MKEKLVIASLVGVISITCDSVQSPTTIVTLESVPVDLNMKTHATLEAYPTPQVRQAVRNVCKDVGINGYLTGQNKCIVGSKHQ
jgi:hypothetical protein